MLKPRVIPTLDFELNTSAIRASQIPLFLPAFFLISVLLMVACEDNGVSIPDGALEEQMVDIKGTWQVTEAWLNDEEITTRLDFGQIILILDMNESPTTYEIETGDAPFPVIDDGNWSYDDVVYPTRMQFTNSATQEMVHFAQPPISGDQQFSIFFEMGCPDNIYRYVFRKI